MADLQSHYIGSVALQKYRCSKCFTINEVYFTRSPVVTRAYATYCLVCRNRLAFVLSDSKPEIRIPPTNNQ